jgi:hypothetical protein
VAPTYILFIKYSHYLYSTYIAFLSRGSSSALPRLPPLPSSSLSSRGRSQFGQLLPILPKEHILPSAVHNTQGPVMDCMLRPPKAEYASGASIPDNIDSSHTFKAVGGTNQNILLFRHSPSVVIIKCPQLIRCENLIASKWIRY